MLHLTNCPLHVQPARSSASQPCCPSPGTKYIESLKKQDYSDHWASSRRYPQRSAVSNVDEVGKTIRMGKGQSTHMTLIQCIFLNSQMKFKPSLLRSYQRERIYPKGELTPTADLHAHKSSTWLNRCQVWEELWGSSDEREYLKPAQNKYLWSINTHRHIPPPLSTEQRLPLQSVLQHVRHIDKASRSLGFFLSSE